MDNRLMYPGSLHNHTDYSNLRLRDCINKVEELIDYAIKLGHECIAITDHEALSSFVKVEKYYKKIKEKNPNFKVIRGNEIYLTRNNLNGQNYDTARDKYFHFILLAKDYIGYQQLCELSTRAWNRSYVTRQMRRVPTYYQDLKDIVGKNKGHLIASTACLGSFLAQTLLKGGKENYDIARNWCLYMNDLFGEGHFYLEIQPSENKEQILVNNAMLLLSHELNIPYIITTDSHYLTKEDAFIHEAFLNSQDGEREVRSFYATTYMMSTKELESYFNYFTREDLDKAYQNIQIIKSMCEDFSIFQPLNIPRLKWIDHSITSSIDYYCEKMPTLNKFVTSPHKSDNELTKALIAGIESKEDLQNEEAYAALDRCLQMTWDSSEVNKSRWSAYYLNLQNIIQCCWDAGSIVLPARGSGGGFLLLYALDIIEINALRENTRLYDWRFLNPERVSVLDIDFDISGLKRATVLNYLKNEYGNDRISNVATFGTEKSKSAILTSCRGLGISIEEAQYISSLIVSERGILHTLSQTYYGDEENGISPNKTFIQEMYNYPEVWRVAQRIEGLISRVG